MIYTAITIGPIMKTLQKARSTKAIWSASYLFSHIMESIYKKVETEVGKGKILLPSYKEFESLQVGIFPDRIMFEGEITNFDQLKDEIINEIATVISNDLEVEKKDIQEYLNNYLTIKEVKKEFDKGEKVVKNLNELLDTLELFNTAGLAGDEDNLSSFLEMTEGKYNSFIRKEFKGQPFKSIEDIIKGSAKENYIAIVQADGDNFGQFISNLTDKEAIQNVSNCLLNFSIRAVEEIKKKKGVPIYAGGDDLLFFIPVAFEKETLLEVIEQIDKAFKEQVLENEKMKELNNKPSLSYGVNIFYKNFPLDQALREAGELLFHKAKTGDKNAIAVRITKHSGQVIEMILHKNQKNLMTHIKEFLDSLVTEENLISNFMYKLSPLKPIIKAIALSKYNKEKWEAFFKNYFNEDNHKKSLEDGFLSKVKKVMVDIYTKYPLTGTDDEINAQHDKNINLIYAILRFHQFINVKNEL